MTNFESTPSNCNEYLVQPKIPLLSLDEKECTSSNTSVQEKQPILDLIDNLFHGANHPPKYNEHSQRKMILYIPVTNLSLTNM